MIGPCPIATSLEKVHQAQSSDRCFGQLDLSVSIQGRTLSDKPAIGQRGVVAAMLEAVDGVL